MSALQTQCLFFIWYIGEKTFHPMIFTYLIAFNKKAIFGFRESSFKACSFYGFFS